MFIYGKFIKLINCLCLTHVLFTPYFALIPPFLRNTYRIKQTKFNLSDLLNFSSAKRFILYYAACLSVGSPGVCSASHAALISARRFSGNFMVTSLRDIENVALPR